MKNEKDPVNIIVASKDFITGYPKHCINKCSERFGIRLFEKNPQEIGLY